MLDSMPLEKIEESTFDIISEREKLKENVPAFQIVNFFIYCAEKHWKIQSERVLIVVEELN